MLDWKWRRGDPNLASWKASDLEEYLLQFFPLSVPAGAELIADTPACVVALLQMLANHGVLEGGVLPVLLGRVEELAEDFVTAASDPGNWSAAKTVALDLRPPDAGPPAGQDGP